MAGPVHYEIYIRKTAPAPWSLLQATEDRKHAIETAEDILADNRAVAVRVTKETLDPETMAFQSVTVLTRGAPEVKQKKIVRDDAKVSNCVAPQDLYAPHARELIGRVLEDWLARQHATPFELLHRPDLVELLEASGVELQHAMQKIAVPESEVTGQSVHDLIRHYQRLSAQAMDHVMRSGARGLFPSLESGRQTIAEAAHSLAGEPDRAFRMGGAVCNVLKDIRDGRGRLDRLMDMADQAPAEGPARALVMVVIEQILCELFSQRRRRAEILGPSLDVGANLAALVRMVAPGEIEALLQVEPRLTAQIPAIDGPPERLARRLAAGEFPLLSSAMVREVVRELKGPRRLRPTDAQAEIDILRTLAMALTATIGRLMSLEEVQEAFAERSKSLVTADFVGAYTAPCQTSMDEAAALVRLCENVMGGANKRAAARWLAACVGALRFENDLRNGSASQAGLRLAELAALQRGVRAAALSENDQAEIDQRIGLVGDLVEADARLIAQVGRASVSPVQKLSVLLKMAAGETGPLGPAAERAKAEALRLFRAPEVRTALSASPEALAPLRTLMKTAGLAA